LPLTQLNPVAIASFVGATFLAITRLLTTAKPLWSLLPGSLQGLLPVLVLALPQLALQAAGVHGTLDLLNLLVLSLAMILPGAHSHTVGLAKPSGPGSAAVLLLVFALPLGALQACRPGAVDWPKVAQCTEQLEPDLLKVVGGVLAGTGDVRSELEDVARSQGPDVVLCAVQQLVSDLASGPTTARASRAAARGRAFLDSVQR
jgi:hypothetical protein